jgi:hypothetical protein
MNKFIKLAVLVVSAHIPAVIFATAPAPLWDDTPGVITSRNQFKFTPSTSQAPSDVLKDPMGRMICVFRHDQIGRDGNQAQNVFGFVRDGKCWGEAWGTQSPTGFYYVSAPNGAWLKAGDINPYMNDPAKTPRIFQINNPRGEKWDMGLCLANGIPSKTHFGRGGNACWFVDQNNNGASYAGDGVVVFVPNIPKPAPKELFPDVAGVPISRNMFNFVPSTQNMPDNVLKDAANNPVCVIRYDNAGGDQHLFGYVKGDFCHTSWGDFNPLTQSFFYVVAPKGGWMNMDAARALSNEPVGSPRIFKSNSRGQWEMGLCYVDGSGLAGKTALNSGAHCWYIDANLRPQATNQNVKVFVPAGPAKPLWDDAPGSLTARSKYKFVSSDQDAPVDVLKDQIGNPICTFKIDQWGAGRAQNPFGYVKNGICNTEAWGGQASTRFFYIIPPQGEWLPFEQARSFITSPERTPRVFKTEWDLAICTSNGLAGKNHLGDGNCLYVDPKTGGGVSNASNVLIYVPIDKAAIEKAAAEKAAQEKAATDRLAAEQAAKKAAEDKAAADEALKKAAAEKLATDEALKKANAEKAAAEGAIKKAQDAQNAAKTEGDKLLALQASSEAASKKAAADQAAAKAAQDQAQADMKLAKAEADKLAMQKLASDEAAKKAAQDKTAADEAAKKAAQDKAAADEAAQKALAAQISAKSEAEKLAAQQAASDAASKKAQADMSAAKAAQDKAASDSAAAKAASEKALADKAALDKAQADKERADKETFDKLNGERDSAKKAKELADAAQKAAADAIQKAKDAAENAKSVGEKIAADKAQADALIAKADADQKAAKAATEKAAADKALADKALADKVVAEAASQKAAKEKEQAEQAKADAQKQQQDAEGAANAALQKQKEAEEATKRALAEMAAAKTAFEKQMAELKAKQAAEEQAVADAAKKKADDEKALADEAAKKAEAERVAAEEARKKAEAEKAKAEATVKEVKTTSAGKLEYGFVTVEEAQRINDNGDGFIVRVGNRAVCFADTGVEGITIQYAGMLSRKSGMCGLPGSLGIPANADGGIDVRDNIKVLVSKNDLPNWIKADAAIPEKWFTNSGLKPDSDTKNPSFGICRVMNTQKNKYEMGMAIFRNGGECYLRGDTEGKATPFSSNVVEILVKP